MGEQKSLEWFEYDEAEMQISVLQSKIDEAQSDLDSFELSAFSRTAIMNEVQRHVHFIEDIKEEMDGPAQTEPIDIVGVDDEL